MRADFIASKPLERGFENAILTASAVIGQTRFDCLAVGVHAAGDAYPEARQRPALLDDVERVAVARRIGPRGFLACAQTGAGVGNRVTGGESCSCRSSRWMAQVSPSR